MAANRDDKSAFDDLISVREAAQILHVSESTVWRWIGRGILKAHRIGPKRICLRREELEPVLKPVEESKEAREARLRSYIWTPPEPTRRDTDAPETPEEKDQRLRSYLRPMSPGPTEDPQVLVARIRKRNAEILATRGGVPFPESWIDINETREERYLDL